MTEGTGVYKGSRLSPHKVVIDNLLPYSLTVHCSDPFHDLGFRCCRELKTLPSDGTLRGLCLSCERVSSVP